LENTEKHYKSNPLKYISHLIGHEGPNSLLSLLIDEGLALELSSSQTEQMRTFSYFNLTIKLTKKGLENRNTVIKHVFAYLKMIQEKGV
jgi:insulysin